MNADHRAMYRERPMDMQRHHPAQRPGKLIASLFLAASAVLLSSCGNSQMTTGSIPDDYRTRHPIVLAEGETTLDIPVASGDIRLTNGLKDTVRGFAQKFLSSPAAVMQIQVPSGSYNSGAASHLAGRAGLYGAGAELGGGFGCFVCSWWPTGHTRLRLAVGRLWQRVYKRTR